MTFGISASSNRSRSSSTGSSSSSSRGSSFGRQGSRSDSVSGGFSRSGSQNVGTSRQDIAFEDVFARLFGGAEGAASGLDPSMLTDAANMLFGSGMDFLDSLGADAGTAFMEERLAGQNELVDEQIALLQEDIGRLFSEELNPAVTAEAVAGGALGGGRQGVAQGRALDVAGREFRRGATAIRTEDLRAKDQIARDLSASNIARTQTGMGGLSQMLSLAESGMMANMMPSMALAQILGPMQTLTSSDTFGSSFATAEDFARALSESFGVSGSEQHSRSQASHRSSSSSRGGSFGISMPTGY